MREGRAAEALKMERHTQIDTKDSENHEATCAINYVRCVDDSFSDTETDQTDRSGQPERYVNQDQPECSAMEAPPSPSSVSSLPPTDLVMVEAQLGELHCTVHEIGGSEIERRRNEEIAAH